MKILYVEDEEDLAFLVTKYLQKNGFIVDYEKDGARGYTSASVNKYDLLILDINLPLKNGISICEDLRKDNINTPIIFLTTHQDQEILIKSFKSGGDDYVKKPFDMEELLLRINAILKRPTNYIGKTISLDDFILDTNSKRLYYRDSFINLTKKEFVLIEFFMRNQNKVLSREELLENVWDMNIDPFSNIVEAYIKNIRKKIRQYSEDEFIHNIQGIGYYIGKNRPTLNKDSFYS